MRCVLLADSGGAQVTESVVQVGWVDASAAGDLVAAGCAVMAACQTSAQAKQRCFARHRKHRGFAEVARARLAVAALDAALLDSSVAVARSQVVQEVSGRAPSHARARLLGQ